MSKTHDATAAFWRAFYRHYRNSEDKHESARCALEEAQTKHPAADGAALQAAFDEATDAA